MLRVGTERKMARQVDEKVNRDKTGDVDETNLEVDSEDKVMRI